MVTVSTEAIKFINDLLEKNEKKGYGIRIYLAGMGCSGPQFGMAFQEKKNSDDNEEKVDGFSFLFMSDPQSVSSKDYESLAFTYNYGVHYAWNFGEKYLVKPEVKWRKWDGDTYEKTDEEYTVSFGWRF